MREETAGQPVITYEWIFCLERTLPNKMDIWFGSVRYKGMWKNRKSIDKRYDKWYSVFLKRCTAYLCGTLNNVSRITLKHCLMPQIETKIV